MANLTVELAEFVRTFAIQDKPRLMIFLGAGTSARAGIPTATELIWIFKRMIYCSETGSDQEALRDLSVDRNKQRLQDYFDEKKSFPEQGAEDEYSIYFERAIPDPGYRRTFIRQILKHGRPTIGHECLAVLLAQCRADWVWTTNFDDLVERAERTNAPRRLNHVGPESGARMNTILADDLRPVVVKLHGDYRYDSLQNTDEELQQLDIALRKNMVDICQDNGLIVIGYSGRDESIMSTLEDVAAHGFKYGIYWCIRAGSTPNKRVQALVEQVTCQTKRGGFVQIPGFDDFFYRLYRQCNLKDPEIEQKAESLFEQRRPFRLFTESQPRNRLKLNAIKIVEYPTSPYRFQTNISGWRELREIIAEKPIVAGLLKGHVLAFGNRERIRTVFGEKITSPIEVADVRPNDMLRSDSVTLGLFYDIVGQSLVGAYGLQRVGRRTFFLPYNAADGMNRDFAFRHINQNFRIPIITRKDNYIINEGFSFQLDFHEDNLWFVLEPTVVVTCDGVNLAPIERRKYFTNSVVSGRYNSKVHEMLLFWIYYLSSIRNPISFIFPPNEEASARIVLDGHYGYTAERGIVS